jgi:uncharacterized membrane protein
MTLAMMPAMGLLFFYIGTLMSKLKRNWFIGIRNPWTLSSDKVWNKTHKLGGTLFKVLGIIMVLGILVASKYIVWIILVPVFTIVIWLFVYSYLEYKRIKKE